MVAMAMDRGSGDSTLGPESDRSTALTDGTLAEAARQCIVRESHLRVQRIWCEFRDGVLILQGQVPSFYYKQLAQEAVGGIAGVRQIVNEIEVVW